jgi:hypothetical protein
VADWVVCASAISADNRSKGELDKGRKMRNNVFRRSYTLILTSYLFAVQHCPPILHHFRIQLGGKFNYSESFEVIPSMSSVFQLRLPAHLTTSPTSPSTAFDDRVCQGRWYLIRTSNRYWKDKFNILTECHPSGTDCFLYQTKPGGALKTM